MDVMQTKALVLGGSGMLGHKVAQVFGDRYEVTAAFRGSEGSWPSLPLFTESVQAVGGIDAEDFDTVRRVVDCARPGVVVNCIGVVKQREAASDPVDPSSSTLCFPIARGLCGEPGLPV